MTVSCSTYVRTLTTRMISPETHGGLGHGALEARLQSSKRDKLDVADNTTDNAIDRADAPYALAGMGEIGFFKRLDLFIIPSLSVTPTLFGLKYQFIGSPKLEAKKGNFSTSLMIGYGQMGVKETDSGDLEDILNDNIEEIEVNTRHEEVGLVAGYRWSENFLHYANVVYLHEKVDGKVTTDSGTLVDAPYSYDQDGMIYSTGFILYFGSHAHWKVDYSHLVSDWTRTQKQTANTLNTAIGFNW